VKADVSEPSGRIDVLVRRWRHWLRERRRQGKGLLPFHIGGSARLLLLLVGSLVVLGVAFVTTVRYTEPVTNGRQLSLDGLLSAAQAHQIKSAELHDFDHRITGTLSGGIQYWTTYPSSDAETPALLDQLRSGGVSPISVDSQSNKQVVHFVATYLLPLILLANLFAIIFVSTQGGGDALGGLSTFGSIGKERGKEHGDEQGHVTFADVAGAEMAVVELSEVKDYLTDPERFSALGAKPPKGVMMFGPPGCGKTLMARAVAGEAGVPFFSISGAEFVESLVGIGAARVRDLFRQVRQVAPAIVFIDEIDAAGRRRGGVAGGQEEREQTLNQLLIEMDGFEPSAGIVVIGATNRPDILDPALMRPGRFDRQITVEPPDLDGRVAILDLYASRRPMEGDVDLNLIAKRTPGFTGADLAAVINEAALLAVRQGKSTIAAADLDEAVQRVLTGPRRKGHLLSDEERLRAAYHESAHVLVATLTGRMGDIPRVTIVAHGRNLGATLGRSWAERTLITRSELRHELVTLLAGTVAEELIFGEASTGGDADLERATQVATFMVGRYGMSDKVGRMQLVHLEGNDFLGGDLVPSDIAGSEGLELLRSEVVALLDDAATSADRLLREHREVLDHIVRRLLEHESLEGPQLAPVLDPLRPAKTAPVLVAADADGRGPVTPNAR